VFHELDPDNWDAFLRTQPAALQRGWEKLQLFSKDGLPLQTRQGDHVLAVDVPNLLLILQVESGSSSGVLAIGKDPARLSVQPSAFIGSAGQTAGEIAAAHGGVLAVTGSAFHDSNTDGDGSRLAGYAMCDSVPYGSEHLPAGNKRMEMRQNDLLYVCDVTDPVSSSCTDAVEFRPALIVDGEAAIDDTWAGLQPRVCLGQSKHGDILFLVKEGRIPAPGLLGASLSTCTQLLLRYDGYQAMNLDGGNSAILWYDGHYLTQCSDRDHPEGRPLPNAVVYLGS